jgi:GT2 family glycosyltransferase
MSDSPSLAVVIPAFQAGGYLRRSLAALREFAPEVPVTVVDAGSSDDSAAVAEELGARVVRLAQREGPARARNIGARETAADVILFLDSDCVPHSDVVQRVRRAFADEPGLVSLTGSYDETPPGPGFFSQYMNLRHRFFHQRAKQRDASFWAGCGAVRRESFLALGGFDSQRYPRPQIEDVELGLRMRRVGITRLDPELQVTHLKQWSLRDVVTTDIRSRAIPWARLILASGELPNDLNLGWSQRVASLLAPLALLAVVAGPVALLAGWWAMAAVSGLVLAASFALHASWLRFFARLRGPSFALRAWWFQQVHLLYSAATLAAVTLGYLIRR